MQDRQVYEYAVIRYVPRVERGEFINVGVIVFCKRKKHLSMKYLIDTERINVLSPDGDIVELESYLNAWDLIVKGSSKGDLIAQLDQASRFRWLTATKSTIIQCSEVHPGLSADPNSVLQDLYRKYVL